MKRTSEPNVHIPECPHCGCENADRISDAMLPSDSFSVTESGVFRCLHCRNEYQFLKPVAPQEFSPNAKCPHCDSYNTKVVKTAVVQRYHICLKPGCLKAFRTLRPANERVSKLRENN